MSAVWCVKCNLSTIILLRAHAKGWRVAPARTWPHGMAADEVGFDPLGARAIRHQARRGMKRQRIFSVAQLGMSSEDASNVFDVSRRRRRADDEASPEGPRAASPVLRRQTPDAPIGQTPNRYDAKRATKARVASSTPRMSQLPCEQYDREKIAVDARGSQP